MPLRARTLLGARLDERFANPSLQRQDAVGVTDKLVGTGREDAVFEVGVARLGVDDHLCSREALIGPDEGNDVHAQAIFDQRVEHDADGLEVPGVEGGLDEVVRGDHFGTLAHSTTNEFAVGGAEAEDERCLFVFLAERVGHALPIEEGDQMGAFDAPVPPGSPESTDLAFLDPVLDTGDVHMAETCDIEGREQLFGQVNL